MSTLFSGHTLNPPMHTQPSAFLTLLPLTAEGFAICCRACCRNESTLHPPSCCHPSWDDEQAGQLAHTLPTHTVRDARATCHSARSRSPGLRQRRQGSALPLAGSLPGNSARRTLLAPVVKFARCMSSARRWLLMADRAAIGLNATDAERACPSSSCPRREPLAICLCHAIAFESALAPLVLIHPFAVAGSRCAGL